LLANCFKKFKNKINTFSPPSFFFPHSSSFLSPPFFSFHTPYSLFLIYSFPPSPSSSLVPFLLSPVYSFFYPLLFPLVFPCFFLSFSLFRNFSPPFLLLPIFSFFSLPPFSLFPFFLSLFFFLLLFSSFLLSSSLLYPSHYSFLHFYLYFLSNI